MSSFEPKKGFNMSHAVPITPWLLMIRRLRTHGDVEITVHSVKAIHDQDGIQFASNVLKELMD